MKNRAELWSDSVPIGNRRVHVYERGDRKGLFMKFTSPAKAGRDRRVRKKLESHHTVRDPRGRVDRALVREVLSEVGRLAAPLLRDELPEIMSEAKPLTLAEGFDLALDLHAGKFPTRTPRWEEIRRAQRRLSRLLGAKMPWTAITPGDVRRVWRTLAIEYRDSGERRGVCGARQSEVAVDALYSIGVWLRDEGAIPMDALAPIGGWRSKLKSDWFAITGEIVQPARPRHTPEEMRSLFAHLHDDGVDPRFALAFEMGGEQRMGQVIRCGRAQLVIADERITVPAHAPTPKSDDEYLGALHVLGSGKKIATPIVLDAEARRVVDRALAGYLSNYEVLYLAGEIDDYPLFPAGRLKAGKAKVVADPKPLTRDAALAMFHELERVAGVVLVRGRGWNGVRRVATDVAEDFEHDERVLNALSSHRDTATRRNVYQAPERSIDLRRAASLRRKVRTIDTSTIST